ncbi:MAG: lysophospholipid acyltransferase family protein [Anaplasma sp.]
MIAFPVLSVTHRHFVARGWARGILFLCKITEGITYEILGREHLPEGQFIIASVHRSPLETLVIYTECQDAVFILKQELRYLPIIGAALKSLRMVFIDRSKKVAAMRQVVRECEALAKGGKPVVVFPEGTIGNPDSQELGNLHRSVALIYQRLTVPVVPVVLDTGNYWPDDIFTLNKKSGKATIELLPPIEPGLPVKEFMDRLTNSLASGSKKLGKHHPQAVS